MNLEKLLSYLREFDESYNLQNTTSIQEYISSNDVPMVFTTFKGIFGGIPAFYNHNGVYLNNNVFNQFNSKPPSSIIPLLFGMYIIIHEIQHFKQYVENPDKFYEGEDSDFDIFKEIIIEHEADAEVRLNNVLSDLDIKFMNKQGTSIEDFRRLEDLGIQIPALEPMLSAVKKIHQLYRNNKGNYGNYGDAQYDAVVNGTSL